MAPLSIKLPLPAFRGTPDEAEMPKGPFVEPYSEKPRPPFLAPVGLKNLALRAKVTSSDRNPISGTLDLITDGDKEATDDGVVDLRKGVQWVQIDLGREATLHVLLLWHDHRYLQVFRGVVVQAAEDADFTRNVRTFFNNDRENALGLGVGRDKDYFESNQGRLIDVQGTHARYLRFYSRGSTRCAFNSYTEIEVYGVPVTEVGAR